MNSKELDDWLSEYEECQRKKKIMKSERNNTGSTHKSKHNLSHKVTNANELTHKTTMTLWLMIYLFVGILMGSIHKYLAIFCGSITGIILVTGLIKDLMNVRR